MIDIPDILNYGGFGLAVVIILVVSRFAYVYFNKATLRQDEATTREREITDRAMEREKERADQAMGDWQALVESSISANQKVADTMDIMCREIRNGIKQDAKAHNAMQLQLSKLEK